MKLAEALAIVTKAPVDAKAMPVVLACGFTPLHLQNYLAAYLQQAHPDRKVAIETGLFGDVAGTIARFAKGHTALGALALEWQDLDPRLGYRQTGGWGQRLVPSILGSVQDRLKQLESAIGEIPSASRLVISTPTLDLPPAFHTSGWQASEAEVALELAVAEFASRVVAHPAVFLLNRHRLQSVSPPAARYDFRSDLNTGFPYTQGHAEALGSAFAKLLRFPEPKKGLITDLDDTLWLGLVGEIGHQEIAWDLASHAQMHGLYQQMLRAFAEQGVLVAIASKNSSEVVEKALARTDLILDRERVFPLEVHWDVKSGSVNRILKTWNISADSVVFIDDSPMELAEVKAQHPGMECILFPKGDYAAGFAFLQRLRDLFGKPRLSEEDSFRLQSIRQGQKFAELSRTGSANDLLASAEAVLTVEFSGHSADRRTVELVNKTNQFNLNGRRFTEAEWLESLVGPGSFVMAISYEDKFGPLGKIAAVRGRRTADCLIIDAWVMSCRAFSRQIEHQTLVQLFSEFAAEELRFEYAATSKNQPISEFLTELLGQAPSAECRLSQAEFAAKCPELHHRVVVKHE